MVSIVELHLGDGRLQHLQHQGSRRRISVLRQRSNFVGLAIQGVFVGDGKHLCIVQGLPQRDKTEPAVVREFRLAQSSGIPHTLVMHALFEVASKCRRHGLVRPSVIHHRLVQRQASKQVVVVVVGGTALRGLRRRFKPLPCENAGVVGQIPRRHIARQIRGVLPEVGECQDVSDILGVGLGVDDVDFNPVDHRPRVGNGQGLHGLVILVDEVLRKEVVPVGFVIVRTDVELLGLGPSLDLYFTSFSLLLTEDRCVVQATPLGFQLQSKQTLRTRDQAAVEWHAYVPRFDVLQNVVLFTLEPDVHLVFEVEQRLGVELGAEFNLVTNFPAQVQLNSLVKIHRPRPSLALGNPRVFRVVPSVAQRDFRRSLGFDFDFIAAENHLE